jgi:diguanylate cyclase (GGDEF)-like protein
LTGAALGNVKFGLALEEEVSAREEEAETASREHVQELQRRDDIEREKERIAVTDVLTGMLNRRGFFLQAEQGFKLARRQGLASAVIFADIDGLKTVNDELGHDVGDHLIQAGALILRDSFRDSDIVARLGGDEFAAFTVDSGQPEAILARIRENVDQFHRRSSIPYRISFSTGIVQCDPASDQSLADYLALADKRMYEEKKRRSGG